MKLSCKHRGSLLLGTAFLVVGTTLPSWADYQATVLSQGPVGYWRLNETTQPQPTTPAANLGSLGSSANGTYNNLPTRGLTGPFAGSKAVGLDGSTPGTSVATPWQGALNPGTFSAEIWANPSVVPKFAYVMSSAALSSPRTGWYMAQDDGSTFGAGSAFVVRMFFNSSTTPSVQLAAPITQPAGTWYHLVLTYDGATAALYMNGVQVTNHAAAYVANASGQYSVGMRSDNNFWWPGLAAEPALYGAALSPAQVSAHYTAATTAPATYGTTVLADSPLLYWRFTESAQPVAANIGTGGASDNGLYFYNATVGVAGPQTSGFDVANKAVSFDGSGGGAVRVPALNLNANTVTITTWIKANGVQTAATGLIFCRAGTTVAGLNIDAIGGGLGLGYTWANDINTYNWSPSIDAGLGALPDSQWAFAALVVSPSQAAIFLGDPANPSGFMGVTNPIAHAVQNFDGVTLFGQDSSASNRQLNGALDEVAMFNRSLGAGEVFTEFATAVGGLAPRIFTDLQGPTDPVAAGDPLVLTIDAGGTAPLSYAWHKGGSPVATTTSGVLTIASSSPTDGGDYDVTVSNGSGSAQSSHVTVSVVTPTSPSIVQLQGFQNRTLYPTGTLSMVISAAGGGLKYQWFKGSTAITSATTSAFKITSLVGGDAGSYSVSITNSMGSNYAGPAVITIPSSPAGSYEALVIASGPEAWWRLDETAGSTNLWDGMGRHDGYYTNQLGTVPPVALGVTGALANDPNTAASFTPANQGVGVIPYSAGLNPSQFSIEAWVKTTVLDGIVPYSSIDAAGNGCWAQAIGGWWYGDTGGGYFGNNGNVNTAAQIVSGQWSHVVIEYDATRQISGTYYPFVLYVNGQTDGYVWGGSTTPNTGAPFIIGAHNGTSPAFVDRFFDGQVDEVAVYKRLLGGTEILSHFNGRFGSTTPPYFIGGFLPQTITEGKTISYTTIVQGSVPLTVQWYKNGSRISGATTSSYGITNATVADTGTYTLWATNVAGVSSQSVSVTVIPPVSYANVTNGLVLHLKFDGDANDSSGRGNNGTPVNSPAFVPGIIGSQALQYTTETVTNSGTVSFVSSSYVNLGSPADLQFGSATSFSVSLWVQLAAGFLEGDLPFIGNATNSNNNLGWDLSPTYQSGGWQWCLDDGVSALDVNGAAGSFGDGVWHNFVLTVDRTAKVANTYVDGISMAARDITSLGSVDTGPIIIGQDPTGTYPEAGTALLDDLGIWRRVLTPLEIAKICSAGSTGGRSFDSVAPPVTINVNRSGSTVTLSWTTGTLLQSDTLGASAVWTPVPGATPPSYTPSTGSASKYYRVFVQ